MSAGNALLNARAILEALEVGPGLHIADIGPGHTGHFTFGASRFVGNDGRVYAVDVRPDVVRGLERQCGFRGAANVHPVWGDVEHPGGVAIADASLDLVLVVHMLSTLADWESMAREVRRLVRPGGRIVVIDWEPMAYHPVAAQVQRFASGHEADAVFATSGCQKCGEMRPSRWHWGRVYSS